MPASYKFNIQEADGIDKIDFKTLVRWSKTLWNFRFCRSLDIAEKLFKHGTPGIGQPIDSFSVIGGLPHIAYHALKADPPAAALSESLKKYVPAEVDAYLFHWLSLYQTALYAKNYTDAREAWEQLTKYFSSLTDNQKTKLSNAFTEALMVCLNNGLLYNEPGNPVTIIMVRAVNMTCTEFGVAYPLGKTGLQSYDIGSFDDVILTGLAVVQGEEKVRKYQRQVMAALTERIEIHELDLPVF